MAEIKRSIVIVKGLLVLAAMVTAGIHLYLGARFNDTLFLLNAVGFMGLTAAYLLPWKFLTRTRELARWGLIGYSALTIILWAVINGKLDGIGLTTKAAELAIIILLLVDRKHQ